MSKKAYKWLVIVITVFLIISNLFTLRLYNRQIISSQPNFIQFYNKQKIICLYNDECRLKYIHEDEKDKIMINGYEYYMNLNKEKYTKEYWNFLGLNSYFIDEYWQSEYFKASPVVLNYYKSLSKGLDEKQKEYVAKCLLDTSCSFNYNQSKKYAS